MDRLRHLDLAVLAVYLAATVGMGCWFAFRRRNAESFLTGNRSLPGWAVGLSMFGSYVSSISFLANPGKAFDTNWNAFVFSLATPVAALAAVLWFVPFYRRTGEVSAYEHLGRRFGPWARTYAVACFLLTQVARIGTIVYLLAQAVAPLLGGPESQHDPETRQKWLVALILAIGVLMILYSVFGGIEAVVWVGAAQSVILIVGPLACLAVLLGKVPGGLGEVVSVASAEGKFSLGSLSPSPAASTFWVVLLYGLTINLTNFGVDQAYVQRYITTPTTAEARRSVWITAGLFVPVSGFFFFLGTALFVLYKTRPELFPPDAAKTPDALLPYFIAHHLPAGLGGLVVASVFAAALDSNLPSMATLTLCDGYKRYIRPEAGERESLWVLRGSAVFWGMAGTAAGLAMIGAKTVLDVWWELAGVFSGGMLGVFLLGLICRRATKAGNAAAATAVVLAVFVMVWIMLSAYKRGKPEEVWPAALGGVRSPLHGFMAAVVGTVIIVLLGLLGGILVRAAVAGRRDALPRARPGERPPA